MHFLLHLLSLFVLLSVFASSCWLIYMPGMIFCWQLLIQIHKGIISSYGQKKEIHLGFSAHHVNRKIIKFSLPLFVWSDLIVLRICMGCCCCCVLFLEIVSFIELQDNILCIQSCQTYQS